MEDQRLLERWNLSDYVEVYDRSEDKFIGHIVDLSTDGMKVFGESPVRTDTYSTFPLTLRLPRTGGDTSEVILHASGVWCEEDSDPEMSEFYNTGFQFISLSPEDYQRVEQLIEDSSFRDWQRIPVY